MCASPGAVRRAGRSPRCLGFERGGGGFEHSGALDMRDVAQASEPGRTAVIPSGKTGCPWRRSRATRRHREGRRPFWRERRARRQSCTDALKVHAFNRAFPGTRLAAPRECARPNSSSGQDGSGGERAVDAPWTGDTGTRFGASPWGSRTTGVSHGRSRASFGVRERSRW
jgi:hypothetical protein